MEPGEIKELTIYETSAPPPMSIIEVKRQVNTIQEIMREVMKEGEHYGKIPGCGDKPTLLKAGAEKINLTFRMIPKYIIERIDLPNGHREYIITTQLFDANNNFIGEGVGSCSTMESKYRYRNVADYELTDMPIPKDAKEKKVEYRKQGYGMKKVDGIWYWVNFKDDAKQENPDIADIYNTVLKMAKKRALVDAVLTRTAASDIFTQDIEDMVENGTIPNGNNKKQSKPVDDFPDFAMQSPKVLKMIDSLNAAGKLGNAEKFLGRKSSEWTDADVDKIESAKKRGRPKSTPESSESPQTAQTQETNSNYRGSNNPNSEYMRGAGRITDDQIDIIDGMLSSKGLVLSNFIGSQPLTDLSEAEADKLIEEMAGA